MQWDGNTYARVDLAGTISLTNYSSQPVSIEVTRHILGKAGKADHDGTAEMVNLYEDDSYTPFTPAEYPYWWSWYSWPGWWSHLNGIGRLHWKLTLDAGKSADLGYTWSYFWR